MGILRPALLLVAATLLLPSPPEAVKPPPKRDVARTDPTAPELFGAAFNALGDIGTFCTRQESVCATAQHILMRLEAKATYSAQLIYEWARSDAAGNEKMRPLNNQASIGSLITGSTSTANRTANSQDTLTTEDLLPPWKSAPGGNG